MHDLQNRVAAYHSLRADIVTLVDQGPQTVERCIVLARCLK